MKKKVSVLIVLILCIPVITLAADISLTSTGQIPGAPFQNLQNQINTLSTQLQNIQLTPGPSGPSGPAGPAGPSGPAGPAGPAGTLMICNQGQVLVETDTGWQCGDIKPFSNAVGICVQNSCKLNCSYGWGNCDNNTANGCEKNIVNDPSNCGACGTACPAGDSCINGVCVSASASACNSTTCPDGCCNGDICVTQTSVAACGIGGAACNRCLSGQSCSGGICIDVCPSGICL